MKIFIFGGNGFIGKQVCKDLGENKFDFIKVCRSSEPTLDSVRPHIDQLLAEAAKKKFVSDKETNVIINLAHAPPSFFYNSQKANEIIIQRIITLGKQLKQCVVIQATSESQYFERQRSILFNDLYVKEKKQSLKTLNASGLLVVELSIPSVISKTHNSKNGSDFLLKSYLRSKSPILIVPNIPIKIETSEEVSNRVINFLYSKSAYMAEIIEADVPEIALPDLVKLLAPDKIVFTILFRILLFISFWGSLLIVFTPFITVLNYERVSYYRSLKNRSTEEECSRRAMMLKSYLSSYIR